MKHEPGRAHGGEGGVGAGMTFGGCHLTAAGDAAATLFAAFRALSVAYLQSL